MHTCPDMLDDPDIHVVMAGWKFKDHIPLTMTTSSNEDMIPHGIFSKPGSVPDGKMEI